MGDLVLPAGILQYLGIGTTPFHVRQTPQTQWNHRASKKASIDNPFVQKFTCRQSTDALLLSVAFRYIPTQRLPVLNSSPAGRGCLLRMIEFHP
ncbi:hypothetical protein [Burkholderia sp. ABCPW 14]|uniref:hypothetical protein n=1 Tax=Burkholderia sp. ABCPW 14 TaxID=1637860 RepID=UPI000AC0CF65|nr:hypothetical protein [Burkholderia sp. ABCPW 14]